MSGGITDPTIEALRNVLNLRLQNQNIISSNIANADTPNYKAQAVEFEQSLRHALEISGDLAMEGDHPGHFGVRPGSVVEGHVHEEVNVDEKLDGNTVNRSLEMAKMAENQLLYNASIESLRKKIGMMKYGITEGGGNH